MASTCQGLIVPILTRNSPIRSPRVHASVSAISVLPFWSPELTLPRGLTHGQHGVLEPATRIVVPDEGRIVSRELQQRPARLALRPCIRSRGEEGDHNGRVRSD